MQKKFSSYLLMGKVAALPYLSNKAVASNPPDYTDLTVSQLTLVPLPSAGQVALSDSPYGQSGYGNIPSICVGQGVPSTMSVVVTGVLPGDTVYLAAAVNNNVAQFLSLSPNFQIGSEDLTIIDSFQNNQTTISTQASADTRTSAVRFDVQLGKLSTAGFSFSDQAQFFMQALIVPQTALSLTGSKFWGAARYSSLVTVTADAGKSASSPCYSSGY